MVGNWYNGGSVYSMQGSRPAVAVPRPSQIPGLGAQNDDIAATDSRRPLARDTDSAYVRLAKQGGQRNMLSLESDIPQDNSINVTAARHNPALQQKPDWFYDNTGYHNNNSVSGSESDLLEQHAVPPYHRSALQ